MRNQTRKPYTVTPDKFFDRAQRRKLLKSAKEKAELDLLHGRRSWPVRFMLVDLALYSGLRVAEIAALKLGDLELRAQDPRLTVQHGKGNKKRAVYLDKDLVRHLKDFILLKKASWEESVDNDAPLFSGRSGNHCQPITLMKSFKVAVKSAGLPERYSIHSARHTYATFLLHDTKNMKYVQRQLGHSSIGMTALYAEIMPEENSVLANKIVRD
jgi:site-specific recombinase XerD